MKTWMVRASLFLLLLSSAASSTPSYTGIALQVSPAYTAVKGGLFITPHSRYYFKNEKFSVKGEPTAETYWLIQSGMGIVYGFTHHLEFGLYQILYQDAHRSPEVYNLPDDLFLYATLGGFGRKNGNVRLGTQLEIRFPTAKYHNLVLEPYASDRISWSIKGLFSIITETKDPSRGVNIHANIGYVQHNDLGLTLSGRAHDPIAVQKNTTEWLYGVAFSRSFSEFAFFAELYGRAFAQKPPITAYTRENQLYFSPGIGYRANRWLFLCMALDVLILGRNDETQYDGNKNSYTPRLWYTVPNLPTWRLNISSVLSLQTKKTAATPLPTIKTDQPQIAIDVNAKENKVQQELLKEQIRTESAESELEKIRAERQRMEDLLERLRKILETPTKEKPDNP